MARSVDDKLGRLVSASRLDAILHADRAKLRERIFTRRVTLGLFVEQVISHDPACQDAVGRALSQRVALGLSPCSLNTGPYCKARERLPLAVIEHLLLDIAHDAQPLAASWNGWRRPIKLVDGTVVSMPDTPANQAAFPQNRSQQPGLGFPLARIVGVVSLSSGCVLAYTVSPCEGQATAECRQFQRLLEAFEPGDLVIADRAYASYFLIQAVQDRGIDFLIRDLGRRHPRQPVCGPPQDHLVDWVKPARPRWMDPATYRTARPALRLREVQQGDRRLLTNLRTGSPEQLDSLYQQRWHIELDFRAIKSTLQMDILRCQSPAMIHKEIAAHLLAYNMIRALMVRALQNQSSSPRAYSFAAARRAVARFQEALRHDPCRCFNSAFEQMLNAISAANIPIRPGRVEPRAVKRRPKNPIRLTLPRPLARQNIRLAQQQRLR
ncbi:IS4 family transposase [Panacagrimonas sp.]|uniref:IS4 family transposase n=1 Tax=Panacagrimonas sp. TaxID=2480088 RepID=UPI003B5216AD